MGKTYPKISLIISTYNWPEALRLVLEGISRQSLLPSEIIIADDGSGSETKALLDEAADWFSVAVHHIWQQRNGFQKTTIMNRAIGLASGDYIVQIDGDILTHPRFIQDHAEMAEAGYFVRGSRTLLGNLTTTQQLRAKHTSPIRPFHKDIRNRFNALHEPLLAKLLVRYRKASGNVHGCNLAYWRKDFVQVNGYDNRFKGWGHEDIELAARFINNGILQKKIKMKAVCYHLNHPHQKRTEAERNFKWYLETVQSGLLRCADGYHQQRAKHEEGSADDFEPVKSKS